MTMKFIVGGLAALLLSTTSALAAGACSVGKTITDGKLTIATGNPAFFRG